MAGVKGGQWLEAGVTLGYIGWYAVLIARKHDGLCDWSWPKIILFPIVLTLLTGLAILAIFVIAKINSSRQYIHEADQAEQDTWLREQEWQRYERAQAPPPQMGHRPSWEQIKAQYGLTDADYYSSTALKLRMGGPYTPNIY